MSNHEAPRETDTEPHSEFTKCFGCGYSLEGLPSDGVCPECGFPVERSLQGIMLINSSPEYLSKLQLGLSFVLNGILVQVVLIIIAVIVSFRTAFGGVVVDPFSTLQTVQSLVGTAVGLVMLYGWWQFSTPDPGFTGRDDGSKSRTWLRVSACLVAATQVLALLGSIVGMAINEMLGMGMLAIIGLASFGVWIVMFFSSLLYVRWLAPRVPDRMLDLKAKRNMWLLPLLYVLLFVVLMLGPLIALVMYWNMLDILRKDLRRVRAKQASLA
ncbi:MAG: hypothetical protein AAF138_01155 [Planctomycetota bacterium]